MSARVPTEMHSMNTHKTVMRDTYIHLTRLSNYSAQFPIVPPSHPACVCPTLLRTHSYWSLPGPGIAVPAWATGPDRNMSTGREGQRRMRKTREDVRSSFPLSGGGGRHDERALSLLLPRSLSTQPC